MIWKTIFISVCLVFLARCSNTDDSSNPRPEVDCALVLCTAEFVTINIRVEDPAGVKIALDDFEVIDGQTGKVISRDYTAGEMEMFREMGSYPLYDDSFRGEHQNEERNIIFRGYINAEEVVAEDYKVFADCCHVSLLSGEDPLVLN